MKAGLVVAALLVIGSAMAESPAEKPGGAPGKPAGQQQQNGSRPDGVGQQGGKNSTQRPDIPSLRPKTPSHGKVKIDDKSSADLDLNVTDGVRVKAIGKSAQFRVYPSNDSAAGYFQMRFGKIFEAGADGAPVSKHMVPSMAGEPNSFSFGGYL
jgi:hypothetical protein